MKIFQFLLTDFKKKYGVEIESSLINKIFERINTHFLFHIKTSGSIHQINHPLNEILEMSFDHKPDDPKEKERIDKADGFVSNGRVNGNLSLSRALGDL